MLQPFLSFFFSLPLLYSCDILYSPLLYLLVILENGTWIFMTVQFFSFVCVLCKIYANTDCAEQRALKIREFYEIEFQHTFPLWVFVHLIICKKRTTTTQQQQ